MEYATHTLIDILCRAEKSADAFQEQKFGIHFTNCRVTRLKSKVFILERLWNNVLVHSPLKIGLSVMFKVGDGDYLRVKSLYLDKPTYNKKLSLLLNQEDFGSVLHEG